MNIEDIASLITEDPDTTRVFDGYHFTSNKVANQILTEGFKSLPDDLRDYFVNFDFSEIVPAFAEMLSGPQVDQFWAKIDEVEESNVAEANLFALEDTIGSLWLKKFRDGTFIWLLYDKDDGGDDLYGDVCLGVVLPEDKYELFNYDSSALYFVQTRIPAESFVRVN